MKNQSEDLITYWPAITHAIGEWAEFQVLVEPTDDIADKRYLNPLESIVWIHLGLPTRRAIELCAERAKIWPRCRKLWNPTAHRKTLKRLEKLGWIGRQKVPLRSHSGSLASIRQLESATHKILKLSGRSTLFFAGPGAACSLPDSKFVDVLISGHNFLFAYYLDSLLPAAKVRFWFFSRRHADLAAALIPLPRSSCGVLQRSEMGRLLPGLRTKPKTVRLHHPKAATSAEKQTVTFIYAGRLNHGKNLQKVISLFLELKKRSPLDLQFHIYAPKNRFPIKMQGIEHAIYNQNFLPHGVQFMGDIGQNWENLKPCTNPVYITLSTEIWDDFGVSVEHASRLGWKLLLSDWGGLADAQGKVHFVPVSEIARKAWSDRVVRNVLRFIQPAHVPKSRTRRNGRVARYSSLASILTGRNAEPFRNMKRLDEWVMGAPGAADRIPEDFKLEIFRMLSGEK